MYDVYPRVGCCASFTTVSVYGTVSPCLVHCMQSMTIMTLHAHKGFVYPLFGYRCPYLGVVFAVFWRSGDHTQGIVARSHCVIYCPQSQYCLLSVTKLLSPEHNQAIVPYQQSQYCPLSITRVLSPVRNQYYPLTTIRVLSPVYNQGIVPCP